MAKGMEVSVEEEFGRRLVNDPRYFLETLTSIVDMHGHGFCPFIFNHAQLSYYDRYWKGGIRDHILGKSRKWGFSTQRIGLGFHETIYTPGHVFRIIAQKQKTAEELNRTVKLLYESAERSLIELGQDPRRFLPAYTTDNKREYFFPELQSAIVVDTALGLGIGQSDRSDDLYLTEYSIWRDPEAKHDALTGSLSQHGRTTIDFNARGIGNDAYVKYQNAKKDHDDPEWNGYTPIFYGVDDCPDVYTPEVLEKRKRQLGANFAQEYPSNDQEMFLKSDRAVYDRNAIEGACDMFEGYLCDHLSVDEIRLLECFHGVDCATGEADSEEDSSHQTMSSRAIFEGVLCLICPPIRTQIDEEDFANQVHARWKLYGGMLTIERNTGQAVILRIKQLKTPKWCQLFKAKDPVDKRGKKKIGFFTSGPSKRTMISDYKSLLKGHGMNMEPGSVLHGEALEFEWKGDLQQVAGKPKRKGATDDVLLADMISMQGMKRQTSAAKGYRKANYAT